MNPDHKCTHEENRKKVCGPRGRKIVIGTKRLDFFKITSKLENLIKKFVDENYDLTNEKFPLSICNVCRVTLLEHEKNNKRGPLQKIPNYQDILLTKVTRSQESNVKFGFFDCHCFICLTGKQTSHTKVTKAPGTSRNSQKIITVSNGLHGASTSKVSRLHDNAIKTNAQSSSNILKICGKCCQEIRRGKSHSCDTREHAKRKNIGRFLSTLSGKEKELMASEIIREKIETEESTNQIELRTRGRKREIQIQEIKKATSFTFEDLDNFRVNSDLSANNMKKLASFIRRSAGRKSIPSFYENHLKENSKLLEEVYKSDIPEFQVKNDVKEKRTVVWADAEELVYAVLENRQFIGDHVIKVMAEGGQGFFRICLSIFPSSINDELTSGEMPAKKKKLDPGNVEVKSPMTSVTKLIMLCIQPEIKETYKNIKKLFDLTNINNIPFKFASDLKVLLMINGQQSASSSFPCPYCFVSLRDLKERNEFRPEVEDDALELKTYGDLRRDYNKFLSIGGNEKSAKECHSVINSLLFKEDDGILVIDKCVVPELHIMQGFVNHLFWNGLVPLVGRETALLWPKKLKIISKNYHGDISEGNACRRLLKEADSLNDKEIYSDLGPFVVVPYISAFRTMNKIVDACFSMVRKTSFDDLDELIEQLSKHLLAVNASETLKIHILLKHVEQLLELISDSDGLGLWSEQPGESAHREFLKFWNKRKINSMEDSSYQKRLKDAVVEFSSLHI